MLYGKTEVINQGYYCLVNLHTPNVSILMRSVNSKSNLQVNFGLPTFAVSGKLIRNSNQLIHINLLETLIHSPMMTLSNLIFEQSFYSFAIRSTYCSAQFGAQLLQICQCLSLFVYWSEDLTCPFGCSRNVPLMKNQFLFIIAVFEPTSTPRLIPHGHLLPPTITQVPSISVCRGW